MKKKLVLNRIKLGIFIVTGAVLLTFLIFKIGTQERLFVKTKDVVAEFKSIEGLKKGSDVRFSGVNVGSVKDIEIISDNNIRVTMGVEAEAAQYIKKDSRAQISSEGIIGSKFVGISSGTAEAESVQSGDRIPTAEGQSMENLLTTLSETSENTKTLTHNLNILTQKLNQGEGTLGKLLSNDDLHTRLVNTLTDFEQAGEKASLLTEKMMGIPVKVEEVAENMKSITDSLQVAGSNAVETSENFARFSEKLNNENGTLAKLATDTAFAARLDNTVEEVNQTAEEIQETSCRVRNSFFIRLFSRN